MEKDKNYWKNVYKAREEIFNFMMDLGVFGLKSSSSVSPFYYDQIIDNGGIGLEFYLGIPSNLYTPLGFLPIFSTHTWCNNKDIIVERLITDYELVLISEAERIYGKSFGPIYAITKLPWMSEPLPVFQYKAQEDSVDFAETKKAYSQNLKLCKDIDDIYGSCRNAEAEKEKPRIEDDFHTNFHVKPYYHHCRNIEAKKPRVEDDFHTNFHVKPY